MQRQKPFRKKLILGVTGSFGSGKSTVSAIMKSWGAAVVDADEIARECLKPKTPTYKRIIGCFGKGILRDNAQINRAKLALCVFSNRVLLNKLNAIVHPRVIRVIKKKIKSANKSVVIIDAPLLIEAGLEKLVDKLIVVTILRNKQIKRLQKRDGLSGSLILKRIKSQLPQKEKERLADFVIDNSGTVKQTEKQVGLIWRKVWKS